MCHHCTRREFIGTTAVSAWWLAAGPGQQSGGAAAKRAKQIPAKVPVCVMFTGNPGPADRGWGVDASQVEAMTKRLKVAEKRLGNVLLTIGPARSAAEAGKLMEQAGPDAPVLAVVMYIGSLLRVAPTVLDSGRPMAVFALPASGHDWMYPLRWAEEGKRVTLFPTSELDELERALRLLRVVPLMAHSRVLLFPPPRGTPPACTPEKVKERLGTEIVVMEQKRFDQMLAEIDERAVKEEYERWVKGAKRIVEPAEEDIMKAARVCVALNQLVDQEGAQGLAVGTCMGWLPRGFPCLGFSRLRDRGLPASCEGDMDSLWTMMLFRYAFDLPGFQGNQTFDTAKNALWTAHCVGPLKMDGIDGEEAPYLLRGHSEVGGNGCVPEVQYRFGQTVTRTKLINLDSFLVSTGKIIAVPELSVRACRTQIVTEVADASAMVANWGGGVLEGDMMTLLHRVVFYGDHVNSVEHMARLFGMKVIHEG